MPKKNWIVTLKEEDGITVRFQAEVLRLPAGWKPVRHLGVAFDDDFYYDNISPLIGRLAHEFDSLDFSTDQSKMELLGWDNYDPNQYLWDKLLAGLEGLGFVFKKP